MKTKNRQGFTLIELLVTTAILLIVFGLVTYLYTRAAKVRKIIVVNSEIQQSLSQILTTLTYGEDKNWGLIDATSIESGTPTTFVVNKDGTEKMEARIEEGTIKISWEEDFYTNNINLDPGKKIEILISGDSETPLSIFEYFNYKGEKVDETNIASITFIQITLCAKSTDPAMKNSPPVILTTGVKLRNKIYFPPSP